MNFLFLEIDFYQFFELQKINDFFETGKIEI